MIKEVVDFVDLTPKIIDAIKEIDPQEFSEKDVVSIKSLDSVVDHSVKVRLNDTLFMIKKRDLEKELNDQFGDRYDEDFFSNFQKNHEICDVEFC